MFTILLDTISDRSVPVGGACEATAGCHKRYFIIEEDPAKAARCETLCGAGFPATLVRVIRERNVEEGRLAFLLYHCLLAAEKRSKRKETRKTQKAQQNDRVEELQADAGMMARMAQNVSGSYYDGYS